MHISEQTMIESQIGFLCGILLGALASGVFILFFTEWQWYFKLFSCIGSVGILGFLSTNIYQLVKLRRNYIDTQAEMKKLAEEGAEVVKEYTNEI